MKDIASVMLAQQNYCGLCKGSGMILLNGFVGADRSSGAGGALGAVGGGV